MRTAQELRAAADLLCSEIEENQILFSYYEFTEDEQEVIYQYFFEYLNSKKSNKLMPIGMSYFVRNDLDFHYLDSCFSIIMAEYSGFTVLIEQRGRQAISPISYKHNVEITLSCAVAILKLFLDSCVFKNHLKTTA